MRTFGDVRRVGVPQRGVCRQATVEAVTKLVCLTLKRDTFVEILGPLEKIMAREKSPQVWPLSRYLPLLDSLQNSIIRI